MYWKPDLNVKQQAELTSVKHNLALRTSCRGQFNCISGCTEAAVGIHSERSEHTVRMSEPESLAFYSYVCDILTVLSSRCVTSF